MGSALMLVLERLGVRRSAVDGADRLRRSRRGGLLRHLERAFQHVLRAADLQHGPFRIGDIVEVIDSADKPGVKGRVMAINLFYTTLEDPEAANALIQVPNSLFFQKSVRRWR